MELYFAGVAGIRRHTDDALACRLCSDVTDWWKTSYRLMKTFSEESPAVAEVASLLRDATDEFKKRVPLIQSLASPALKPSHWEMLSAKIGTCRACFRMCVLAGGCVQHRAL